jgi:IPT/TIG domain
MRRRLRALAWIGLISGVFAVSCLARRDEPFVRQTDDDAGVPPPIELDGSTPDATPDPLEVEPHVVLGVDPPHGPFVGGTLVMLRGNGFDSDARVWFGDVEVPRSSITPVDPQRIQVLTPPGAAGAVDITVQNGDAKSTSSTLTGGYTYDLFYVTPSSGPTSGGTVITLRGSGTNFGDDTEVEIDREPCEDVTVLGPTELTCTTAASEAGAKVVSVITGGEREDVLDGFLYGNSDNGFRGGLSGQPLADKLTVLAFDDYEGRAIPGVSVLLGDDVATGQLKKTSGEGVASFAGELGPTVTVTLAKECFQPVTFFDVPVDRITAYLLPVLSPACGDLGELPPGGGTPSLGASVSGEVLWSEAQDPDASRRGWTNVPAPSSDDEKEVAYVLRLSDRADEPLQLPSSFYAITPDAAGGVGYEFFQSTSPGNFTLYALAGLEDRSKQPYVFTAYAMGLLRGVAVKPGEVSEDVYIDIDVPLDHALSLTLEPPQPGPRGPDRVRASVAIQIQDQGFALLPGGVTERRLPGAKEFSFVGVPPLVGTLSGASYRLSARAVTGQAGAPPLSVIGSFSAVSTAEQLDLGGFVPLPVLTMPAKDTRWDLRRLDLTQTTASQPVDLTVVRVTAGGGLHEWTIVAPGPRTQLSLPDLAELDPGAALPRGSIEIETTLAHIRDFNYGTLRYRELTPRGWNAYATDTNYTQH